MGQMHIICDGRCLCIKRTLSNKTSVHFFMVKIMTDIRLDQYPRTKPYHIGKPRIINIPNQYKYA